MRRFELVEGKSAKFWQAEANGTTFVVEYGRLGTGGQRKEKDFGDEGAARRELEKKITEKLREGYAEVASDAVAAVPKGAKGAQAASAKLDLPARFTVSATPPKETTLRWAVTALDRLAISVGRRSFVTAHAARQARRGLELLGGVDPAAHPGLAAALDRVLDMVAHETGPRLSMAHALELLAELPTSAFERAMERWSAAKKAPPGVAFLASQIEALEDAELTFRLGALLLDRPGRSTSSAAGWKRRFGALLPHLQAHLARRSSTPRKHLGSLDARGDDLLAARIAEAEQAAGA